MNCKSCRGRLEKIAVGNSTRYRCIFCGREHTAKELGIELDEPTVKQMEQQSTSVGERVFNKNIPYVAEIYCITKNDARCSGSGYIIDKNGMLITNTHVVCDDEDYSVFDKISVVINGHQYPARVIAIGDNKAGLGEGVDLALLQVLNCDNCFSGEVTFANSRDVKNGMDVYVIGNSLGMGTCITSGIISDKDRVLSDHKRYVMTDCAINGGNSGGAMFNSKGEVVGTIVSGMNNAEGMNFAIPVDTILAFIVSALRK